MKSFYLFLFLSMFQSFGQNISEINKDLNLSDTLEFEKEIRIYKDYSNATRIDFFRMFDSGENNWIVYIYYYNKEFKSVTKIDRIDFPKENSGMLKVKDANLIWLNFLICDVEFLPNLKDIDYKLKKASIELEDGEYGISKKKIATLDGVGYTVFVKNGKVENNFIFDSPDCYLKYYPNVDELISYNQILSVIKKEFNL